MADEPAFLILKFPADVDPAMIAQWRAAIADGRGTALAAATADMVAPLEAGSAHNGLIIARFAIARDLDLFWTAAPARPDGLVALAAAGLPWEGWPGHDVPTIATVVMPDDGAPRCYMLIEGTGQDQERLDRYRDIILPMIRERGAYYVLFALGGTTRVLAGDWNETVLAISRWPSRMRAEDFWYSERYQNEAIPLRAGNSRFDVQIVEGIIG